MTSVESNSQVSLLRLENIILYIKENCNSQEKLGFARNMEPN